MSRFFILKFLVFAFCLSHLAGCSYEPDKGLRPGDTNVTGGGSDPLKNKKKSEKIEAKYTALKATCEMKVVKSAAAAVGISDLTTEVFQEASSPVTPPPPQNTISVKDGVLTFDLKMQAQQNPALDQAKEAALEKSDLGLRVEFNFKPLEMRDSINQKIGNTVYLRKHTPILQAGVDLIEQQNGKMISIKRDINVMENMPATFVLKSESTDTERTEYVLVCALTGAIKPQFADHVVDLNCLEKPTEKNESLHKAFCK